jgi:hypothetical protein
MDIASTTSTSSASTGNATSIAMVRKALDLQQQNAQQLLQALPPPTPLPDPNATVGRSINTYA